MIKETVQAVAGPNARAIVFGSRLRDDAKGGDLDLLIEADQGIDLLQRARLKMALEAQLALPVDIITRQRGISTTPFQRIALAKGIPL